MQIDVSGVMIHGYAFVYPKCHRSESVGSQEQLRSLKSAFASRAQKSS